MKNVVLVLFLLIGTVSVAIADPLPSWNNTGSKNAIVSFIERVTKAGLVAQTGNHFYYSYYF